MFPTCAFKRIVLQKTNKQTNQTIEKPTNTRAFHAWRTISELKGTHAQ